MILNYIKVILEPVICYFELLFKNNINIYRFLGSFENLLSFGYTLGTQSAMIQNDLKGHQMEAVQT